MTSKSGAAEKASSIDRRTVLKGVGATTGAFTVGISGFTGGVAASAPSLLCKRELLADQDEDVGYVKVYDNGNIEYKTNHDWVIKEIHLHVNEDGDPIPTTGNGNGNGNGPTNPKVGQFEYSDSFHPPVNAVTVPGSETGYDGDCGKEIAAHAVVLPIDGSELVTNGGFETPEVMNDADWDIYDSGEEDLGWSVKWYGGSSSYMGETRPEIAHLELHRGVNGWTPNNGQQHAELDTDWDGPGGSLNGEPASVKIYQKLDTSESQYCQLKYSWSPRPGHDDNKLEVRWGGSQVATHSDNGSGNDNTDWTDEVLILPSPSDLTKLEFVEKGAPNSMGMFLDDVSVRCISGNGEETAWGDGTPFNDNGGNWATYFTCSCNG